jgi:hypothetical protein
VTSVLKILAEIEDVLTDHASHKGAVIPNPRKGEGSAVRLRIEHADNIYYVAFKSRATEDA